MTIPNSANGAVIQDEPEEILENIKRDWVLFVAVYEPLRAAARRRMRGHLDESSLGATGLVHEVFVRLKKDEKLEDVNDPDYIFACALRAMRQILIDRSRARKRLKRGGGMERVALDEAIEYLELAHVDVIAIHEALHRLEELDRRQSVIVTLSYFLRMTHEEISALMGVSLSTVEKEIRLARAWLRYELSDFRVDTSPEFDGPLDPKSRK